MDVQINVATSQNRGSIWLPFYNTVQPFTDEQGMSGPNLKYWTQGE